MSKKMLIDATHPEETRVVVVDGTKVEEFDFETVNKRQLAGNIYLAKVTRVEPSLQAAFVDYGGNRHGFLAFAEIHPDYYQIPAADRQALIEEERQAAAAAENEELEKAKRNNRRRRPAKAAVANGDAVAVSDEVIASDEIEGMTIVDATEGDFVEVIESRAVDASIESDDAASDDADASGDDDSHDHDEDHGHDHSDDGHDDGIESVAEEDVAEEVRAPRKPRPRRYKIQEVIKVRQIMLVQVVKEERGNKGAALTTYLSLAGRYCVLMPNTARGGGISRKITNVADRKKLKEIASELQVPEGAGLIIRTAGSQRTRTEIRRDYEYLMRLWEQIRELTFRSSAPAPIYEEGDLIKRQIRDLYSKDIDEVLVEGERGYRAAKDFMKMIMPTHAKNVKHYTDTMPLYARYQVESYLSGMFNPVVQLKSGGYIVIGVTEALVAIDVNSGRATKEGSIEDTALKTNLEAADEVARQLRLRDLAGLIVIDFIDMEERRNNAAVEKRFKERLKTDRARIQVGRISGFGLLEMSRQRLRPGMLESTTQPCAHCHGTGLIRSDDSLALTILRGIEEEGTRKRSREVLVKAPVAVANFLMNAKREHIAGIESRYGLSVRVEADPSLISPDYAIEKFKTATRHVPEPSNAVVSVDARLMAQIDDDEAYEHLEDEEEVVIAAEVVTEVEADTDAEAGDENGDAASKSRRRRRRRRRNGRNGEDGAENAAQDGDGDDDCDNDDDDGACAEASDATETGDAADEAGQGTSASDEGSDGERRRRRSRNRGRRRSEGDNAAAVNGAVEGNAVESNAVAAEVAAEAGDAPADAEPAQAPEASPVAEPVADVKAPEAVEASEAPVAAVVAETVEAAPQVEAVAEPAPAPVAEVAPATQPFASAPANAETAPAAEEAPRPKRRGWWSSAG